jgi:lipopolysaccharide biosynthesis glycosyltransferase
MAPASSPGCVICYVSDANFAIPSLISAANARRWVSSQMADIYLLTMGLSDVQFAQLSALSERHQVRVVAMGSDRLLGFDVANVSKTHVPLSTLGRLFLHEFIPDTYDTLLYIDGDTWIMGDITPLVTFQPPERKICAAEDPSFFYRHDIGTTGRRVRAYFSGLGLDGDQGYFNAGVLVSSLATWREIAGDAFAFFCANVERCLFHDQSALNAVAQSRRVKLSSKWDFMTDFRFWNVESAIEPRIFHFTGFPKPWMGEFFPWSDMSTKYACAFDALQATSFAANPLDKRVLAQVEIANRRISRRLATVFRHRRFARAREMMMDVEARAVI